MTTKIFGLLAAAMLCAGSMACGDGAVDPSTAPVPVRILTFGDSNTDGGWNGREPVVEVRSYVSRAPQRLGPSDPNSPLQLAGKIEDVWRRRYANPIAAVNHAIGGTTTGGGMGGGADRHETGSPNARALIGGVTRFEAEVLGLGAPGWHGGEPTNEHYPDGPILRSKAFMPGEYDFAYVSMGTNDVISGLDAAGTLANLQWMVARWIAVGLPPTHLIITTLAPRDSLASESFPAVNQGIRELGETTGIHVIDLAMHTSEDDGRTWKSEDLHVVADPAHYSEEVRDWLAARVVEHMARMVPVRNR